MNLLLNGVLAVIKDAPERAREYFRESGVNSVSTVYAIIIKELDRANDLAKLDCLRDILRQSLRLTNDEEKYVEGVTAVERIIEEEICKIKERTSPEGTEE